MQVGNIQLGIPVRMLRKNPMLGTEIGDMYIYDGLYDVVSSPCRLLQESCNVDQLAAVEPFSSQPFLSHSMA